MAQKIYWSFKDDDSTFNLNRRFLGILDSGLYRGFDAALAAGLNLTLVHTVNGVTEVEINQSATIDVGVLISRQGVVIKETSAIVLPISAGHATLDRIDLIICEHQYVQVTGGQPAVYSVIQGVPSATPVAPALTSPNKQIILGTLFVPATTTNLNGAGVIYTKADNPFFAGDTDVLKSNLKQNSAERKTFDKGIALTQDVATIGGTTITFPSEKGGYVIGNTNGNYLPIDNIASTFGTEVGIPVFVYTLQNVVLKSSYFNTPNSDDVYIEAGEFFILMSYTNGKWAVIKGGEADKNGANKFKKVQKFNYEITAKNIAAGGLLSLGESANTVLVNVSPTEDLNFIGSLAKDGVAISDEYGSWVIIKFTGATAKLIKHNTGGPIPAGYKPILMPNGVDELQEDGGRMLLVETDTAFECHFYSSSITNDRNVPAQVERHYNRFTAMQKWNQTPLVGAPAPPVGTNSPNFDNVAPGLWKPNKAANLTSNGILKPPFFLNAYLIKEIENLGDGTELKVVGFTTTPLKFYIGGVPSSGGLRVENLVGPSIEYDADANGIYCRVASDQQMTLQQISGVWYITALSNLADSAYTLASALNLEINTAWQSIDLSTISIYVYDNTGTLTGAGAAGEQHATTGYFLYQKVGNTVHVAFELNGVDTNTLNATAGDVAAPLYPFDRIEIWTSVLNCTENMRGTGYYQDLVHGGVNLCYVDKIAATSSFNMYLLKGLNTFTNTNSALKGTMTFEAP